MLNRRLSPLVRSSLAVAALSGVSLALAVAREAVLAWRFGASAEMDAYLVAQTVPRLVGQEGMLAVVGALLPPYVVLSRAGRAAEAARLLGRGLLLGMAALAALSLLLAPLSGTATRLLAPGLGAPERHLASACLVALLPMMVCWAMSGFAKAHLESRMRFAAPALAPALMSSGVIAGTVAFGGQVGVLAAALGASVGAAAALALQTLLAARVRADGSSAPPSSPVPAAAGPDDVRLPLREAGTLFLNAALVHFYLAVDRAFASLLSEGAISHLNYGMSVAYVPLLVVSYPIATVLLPRMSEMAGRHDLAGLARTLRRAGAVCGGSLAGTALLLAIASVPVVDVLYGRGAFTAADVDATSDVVVVAALALPATGLHDMFRQAFLAAGRPGVLLRVTLLKLVAKPLLSAALVGPLGAVGLVLATVIVSHAALVYLWMRWQELRSEGLSP